MIEETKTKPRRKAPPNRAANSVNNSHTSPRAIARAERIAEALDYRRQGYSYPAIAAEMNVSVSTAYDLVLAGLTAIIREPGEALLKLELARLDEMQSAIFANACAGDLAAINMVLQIQARRAKLLGLDKSIEAPGFAQLEGATHMKITFVEPDGCEYESTDLGHRSLQ